MDPNDQKSDMAKILLFIFAVVTIILTNSNSYISSDAGDSSKISFFSYK